MHKSVANRASWISLRFIQASASLQLICKDLVFADIVTLNDGGEHGKENKFTTDDARIKLKHLYPTI
jgi:hypothetical protein